MTLSFFLRHYIKRPLFERFILLDYTKKRQLILKYKKKYNADILVETGTFLGDTAFALKVHFEKIYTIELQSELAFKAKERFERDATVEVIQGDSALVLIDLVPKLNSKTIYWLDAHYSAEVAVEGSILMTAKADKETPIIEELEMILKDGLKDNVILIDDARCFTGHHDYPTFLALKQYLRKKGIGEKAVSVKNDIIRITPV